LISRLSKYPTHFLAKLSVPNILSNVLSPLLEDVLFLSID
jgi:hypothetical protein